MALLIKNIKKLVQVEYEPVAYRAGKEMAHLETIDDAFLLTGGEKIVDFGPMKQLTKATLNQVQEQVEIIDATGKM
ncbi:MAG TPA: imidazolonepropionase, partial [Bacteroidales bacterium]|nr:imidazolonepropionase [Bacteroidales bacterium]